MPATERGWALRAVTRGRKLHYITGEVRPPSTFTCRHTFSALAGPSCSSSGVREPPCAGVMRLCCRLKQNNYRLPRHFVTMATPPPSLEFLFMVVNRGESFKWFKVCWFFIYRLWTSSPAGRSLKEPLACVSIELEFSDASVELHHKNHRGRLCVVSQPREAVRMI